MATTITLTHGGDAVTGELYDNPVADQLIDLLPFEADFGDFHDQEKVATLPRSLDVSGVPRSSDAQPAEIGYYAPGAALVLYYANPGRWPGIVRVGKLEMSPEQLRALPDGARIRIDVAP